MSEGLDLDALIEEFRDEARDQVDRLDTGLLELEREGRLPGGVRTELLRTLHTLKGNAAMLGLGPIRDFVHALENRLKEGGGPRSERALERLFEGSAALRRAVEASGRPNQAEAFQELAAATGRLARIEEDDAHAAASGGGPSVEDAVPAGSDDRLRVPFPKLDALLGEVGELIGEADALLATLEAQRDGDPAAGRAAADRAEAIRRRADGLREGVMSLRLVPLARTLGRFHNLVRRLAREQGKEARLVVRGEETEVDKSTADALAEPLLHLVRNAVDHGVEPPAEREAAGKPRHGTVSIEVSRMGDSVRIAVEDDGVGLDRAGIRARAVERGLLGEAEELTEARLVDVIFHAGFSSRSAVSTISGRGVGLDVVRKRIRELRGELALERPATGGTRFVMRLPLTVAIIPSVVFELERETLAFPAAQVVRTIRLGHVDRVGDRAVIRTDDELLPVADPARLFGWPAGGEADLGLIVRHGRRAAVLTAARVVDQRDLVVKALPRYGERPRGVSGASVLPGGQVILLLDADEVIRLAAEGRGP